MTEGEEVGLEKRLGLLNGCGIIIGNIVGSGIFISPTGVLKNCGSVGMSLVFWTLCGLYSILGALCYAELGTTIKASGGEYAYIYEAFGPLMAFMQMWVTVLVIRPAAQAIVSLTFAQYIVQPIADHLELGCSPEDTKTAVLCLAFACIFLITFINCVSVKVSTWINDIFMIAKVLSLVLIILTGAFHMIFKGQTQNYKGAFEGTIWNPFDMSMAFYSGMFAYAGWNYLNFMTDEIVNPNRNLPLAIIISLPLVTVIYVLANVAYFAAMSPEEMKASSAVGISFADEFLGPVSWIMPILVACSTFSAVNGSIMTGSRLTFAGAKNRQMPQFLAMINLDFKTPIPSVFLTGFISCLMCLPDDIGSILNYFSFVFYFTIELAVCVLIFLRFKRPELERPIKFPIVMPIAFVLICTLVLLLSIKADPMSTVMGLLMTLSAIPVYFIFVVWEDKLRIIYIPQIVEKFTLFLQKWLKLVPEKADNAIQMTPTSGEKGATEA